MCYIEFFRKEVDIVSVATHWTKLCRIAQQLLIALDAIVLTIVLMNVVSGGVTLFCLDVPTHHHVL